MTTIADVMTRDPVTVDLEQTAADAARLMAEHDTGAVIVTSNGAASGILTDRDIAVRLVAENKPPDTPISQIVSDTDLAVVDPDTSVEQAVQLMRSRAIRRLPVVENGRVVGVVSLGDLAMEMDQGSALADISAAQGNG
jgi:CBS domain-containing protein